MILYILLEIKLAFSLFFSIMYEYRLFIFISNLFTRCLYSFMAKKSVVARNDRRAKKIEQYAELRNQYKKMLKDPNLSMEDRMQVHFKLQKLPRDSSPVRYKKRCVFTGRGRGVYWGVISRLEMIRRMNKGQLPGFKKASSV